MPAGLINSSTILKLCFFDLPYSIFQPFNSLTLTPWPANFKTMWGITNISIPLTMWRITNILPHNHHTPPCIPNILTFSHNRSLSLSLSLSLVYGMQFTVTVHVNLVLFIWLYLEHICSSPNIFAGKFYILHFFPSPLLMHFPQRF